MTSIAFSYSQGLLYEGDSSSRYKQYLLDKAKIDYQTGLINDAIGAQTDAITGSMGKVSEAFNTMGENIESSIQAGSVRISDSLQKVEASICKGLDDVSRLLCELNRREEMMIEQQRLTNLLLGNIVELLKIPDSEKERQQAISLGIKFFVNAAMNPELYQDSLYYLLKAEQLQPQDYFVLHRIGYIYLYVDYLLDPAKAIDYFSRAGKYAEVESSPNALRIANLLSNQMNSAVISISDDPSMILLLAADSYEKAAFAAYVNNQIDVAIGYQRKAISLNSEPSNIYNLSKYLAHKGKTVDAIRELDVAIESAPKYAIALFQDLDFITNPDIVNWVSDKNDNLDKQLQDIISRTQNPDVASRVKNELENGSYISKRRIYRRAIKLDKTL